MSGGRRIGKAVAKLFMTARRDGSRPVATPGCEYGLIVEERIADLVQDLNEVKTILRWLLFAILGTCIAVVADVVTGFLP